MHVHERGSDALHLGTQLPFDLKLSCMLPMAAAGVLLCHTMLNSPKSTDWACVWPSTLSPWHVLPSTRNVKALNACSNCAFHPGKAAACREHHSHPVLRKDFNFLKAVDACCSMREYAEMTVRISMLPFTTLSTVICCAHA